MQTDKYGQIILSENDLCEMFLSDPETKFKYALTDQVVNLSTSLQLSLIPKLKPYTVTDISIDEFDNLNQLNWYMPKEYKDLDIAKFVLDQCKTEEELQRAGQELLLFQERNMFSLLQYLKYLVDTMRKNNIVWGVGRGSSVSSFVLYLIGIHKINSLYYDLQIEEFLK